MTAQLPILGTCFTILGVFFIVMAIIVKSPRTLMRELLGLRVDRLKTFKYFIAQRLEAIAGFLFILLGSALHIYSHLSEISAAGRATNLGVWLVVTILTMGAIGFLLYRSCSLLAKWMFLRLFRTYATKYRVPIQRDESLLKELGEILRIHKDEHETIETYAKKIRDKLELDYRPKRFG